MPCEEPEKNCSGRKHSTCIELKLKKHPCESKEQKNRKMAEWLESTKQRERGVTWGWKEEQRTYT